MGCAWSGPKCPSAKGWGVMEYLRQAATSAELPVRFWVGSGDSTEVKSLQHNELGARSVRSDVFLIRKRESGPQEGSGPGPLEEG